MIKKIIGKALNKILNLVDYQLVRLSKYPFKSLSIDSSLQRLKVKNIFPHTVIDIGASNGHWTKTVKPHYPDAYYYLIEANPVHEKSLFDFVSKNSNCAFTLAAAADTVGEIFFDDSDPMTGLAAHERDNHCFKRFPCTTVDEEVATNSLKGPFLLKLDTHGFEVPIFNGAIKTLEDTNVIIVETYNFNLTKDSLKFWEMCYFLEQKGFRPVDLMEPMFRPIDDAFWQIDLVFIRANRPEFQISTYK